MSVLSEYWSILTDPAHTMAEVTYDLIVTFAVFFVWNRGIKRLISHEHRVLDVEHGHEHPGEEAATISAEEFEEIVRAHNTGPGGRTWRW